MCDLQKKSRKRQFFCQVTCRNWRKECLVFAWKWKQCDWQWNNVIWNEEKWERREKNRKQNSYQLLCCAWLRWAPLFYFILLKTDFEVEPRSIIVFVAFFFFYLQDILNQSTVALNMEVRPKYLVPDTNCFVDYLHMLQAIANAYPLYQLMVPLVGEWIISWSSFWSLSVDP